MRESLERSTKLVNVPNKATVYSSRPWHSSLSDEHAELGCRDSYRRRRLEFAEAKYNWQKWQYVDSRGRSLHGPYRGGSALDGLVFRQSGNSHSRMERLGCLDRRIEGPWVQFGWVMGVNAIRDELPASNLRCFLNLHWTLWKRNRFHRLYLLRELKPERLKAVKIGALAPPRSGLALRG